MNAPTTTSESMALAASQSFTPPALAAGATSASALMLDDRSMDRMVRMAELMASGKSTIPQHLRGSTGDCLAVVMQAVQWGMNPFAVAQKTHLVNGTLGYEAQLVSAVINNSGIVADRFHFEWFGPWEKIVGKFKEVTSNKKMDDNGQPKKYIVPAWEQKDEHGLGVRVWATIKGEAEPRVLELLMTQARTRNSTLWTEDPKQQLAYLAQKRWARLYAPDVILGVYTPDELDDRQPINMGAAQVVEPSPTGPAPAAEDDPLVVNAYAAAKKGKAAFAQFFNSTPKDDRPKLRAYRAELDAIAAEADAARTVDTAPPFPPADAPVAAQAPGKSFDEVMAMICAAKTEDALFVAGDWVNDWPVGDERTMLEAKFDEQMGNVRGAA